MTQDISSTVPPKRVTEVDLQVLLPTMPPDPPMTAQWASVVALDPLAVRIDGPCMDEEGNEVPCDDPLNVVEPQEVDKTLVEGLLVGDRVWAVNVNRHLIIVGRNGGGSVVQELGPGVDLDTVVTTKATNLARENLYPRPRTTTTTGWGARNSWTLSASATGGYLTGTGYVQVSAPSSATGTNRGINWYQAPEQSVPTVDNGLPVTPGQILTVSGYMYSSKAGTFQLALRFFNAEGAVDTEIFGPSVAGTASTWVRVSNTYPVPEGATHVCGAFLVTDSVAWVTGDQIRVSDVLAEVTATTPSAVGNYFDGNNKGSTHIATVVWEGTPDNSISELYLPEETPGYTVYTQSQSGEASAALHYPENVAGLLEVFQNSNNLTGVPGNMIWHRFTPYGSWGDHFWIRSNYQGTWYPWTRIGDPVPTELGAGVDLDTLITPGVYTQSNSAEATTALNYPEAVACLVEVVNNPGGTTPLNMVWQQVWPYGPFSNRHYFRCQYNDFWYPWTGEGTVNYAGGLTISTLYWKKADGELICRGTGVFPLVENVYYTYNWPFPTAFLYEPHISITVETTVPQNVSTGIMNPLTTSVDLRFLRITTSNTTIWYEARGRWK